MLMSIKKEEKFVLANTMSVQLLITLLRYLGYRFYGLCIVCPVAALGLDQSPFSADLGPYFRLFLRIRRPGCPSFQ